MNNPNDPATSRQNYCLWLSTGKDFRGRNLTKSVASTLIGALMPLRGNKPAALQLAENMLAGKIVATENPVAVQTRDEQFADLWAKAQTAGRMAGENAVPTPMVVGSPTHFLGNDIDPNKKVYFVPEGACGFAWVTVKPGNCAFANWLKKNDLAQKDDYYGGVTIWIHDFGQSIERKSSCARAMAKVFTEAGIKAYAQDRLD